MSSEWGQILFFAGLLVCLTPILGSYIADVFTGKAILAYRTLGWLERLCYRVAGIDPQQEMSWIEYGKALLLFNLFGFVTLWLLLMLQGVLPLNPQHFSAPSWSLAFNIAVSFVTNTNWQAYAGETTLSYLFQMVGITSQNFLSAATGMAVLLAFTRGLIRKNSETIGNFWSDLVQTIVYILLPLSIVLALILVGEGGIQTFSSYKEAITLENAPQVIPLGPVASQIAITQLGSNGGGFFNVNCAHPFETPTAAANFFNMLSILLIPTASIYAYGKMIDSKRRAWLLLLAMVLLWSGGIAVSHLSQHLYNPVMGVYPELEGQETRLGMINTLLWTVSTTATSNGSTNASISSLSPLEGGVAMINMMLGEVIFGGVGVGLCSVLMFTLLTVFLSGLMVGRTPEYLGKKIEKWEMKWVVLAVLMPGALILVGAGVSCALPQALSSLGHEGPHGLSEILYAFSSCAANNGSTFGGLNANTDYYNLALGGVMLLARGAIILPTLAIAGLLAKKKMNPPSIGTFSTESGLFVFLLLAVILIIGGLTFFPALSLGPIVEHLLMLEGESF